MRAILHLISWKKMSLIPGEMMILYRYQILDIDGIEILQYLLFLEAPTEMSRDSSPKKSFALVL